MTAAQSPLPRLPITLNPSPRKWLLVLAISVALGAGGVIMLHDPANSPAWQAWCVIGFFGLCALVSALQLVPGVSRLQLDAQGFEMRALFRRHRTLWKDVVGFGVLGHSPARGVWVGWNYRPGCGPASRLRKFNFDNFGFEAQLPDTYGMEPDELVELLESIRSHRS